MLVYQRVTRTQKAIYKEQGRTEYGMDNNLVYIMVYIIFVRVMKIHVPATLGVRVPGLGI